MDRGSIPTIIPPCLWFSLNLDSTFGSTSSRTRRRRSYPLVWRNYPITNYPLLLPCLLQSKVIYDKIRNPTISIPIPANLQLEDKLQIPTMRYHLLLCPPKVILPHFKHPALANCKTSISIGSGCDECYNFWAKFLTNFCPFHSFIPPIQVVISMSIIHIISICISP